MLKDMKEFGDPNEQQTKRLKFVDLDIKAQDEEDELKKLSDEQLEALGDSRFIEPAKRKP